MEVDLLKKIPRRDPDLHKDDSLIVTGPFGAPSVGVQRDRRSQEHLLLSGVCKGRWPERRPPGRVDEAIHDEFPGYGYRRVTLELRNHGYVINHKRVAREVR